MTDLVRDFDEQTGEVLVPRVLTAAQREGSRRAQVISSSKVPCDGRHACTLPASMIDEKGYAYCAGHGERLSSGRRVRRLTIDELIGLAGGRLVDRF